MRDMNSSKLIKKKIATLLQTYEKDIKFVAIIKSIKLILNSYFTHGYQIANFHLFI